MVKSQLHHTILIFQIRKLTDKISITTGTMWKAVIVAKNRSDGGKLFTDM